MGRKSSKTAHVLNLLTAGASDEVLSEGDQLEEELSVAKMVQKQPTRAKKTPSAKNNQEPIVTKPSNPFAEAPVIVQPEASVMEPLPAAAEAVPEPQPASLPLPVVTTPLDSTPAPAPQPPAPRAEPIPAPEAKLSFPEAVQQLVNIAEYAIANRVDEIIERMNVCRCSLCKKDIVAAALNLVPVQYVLSEDLQGNVLDTYLAEYGKEVTAALVKACIKVKTNSRH